LRVLVVNAGSSSLKLTLLDGEDRTLAAHELPLGDAVCDEPGDPAASPSFDRRELRPLLAEMPAIDAVGHRIVHGGERFREAVRVDGEVDAELRALAELAPLHQAKSLAALDAVSGLLPHVPAVACFDTAFHATMPAAASTYALPASWRERFGVRRFGFHGLSHAWVARRAPELLGESPAALRLVSCHLGAGASLCAIAHGCSIDTTMGFTPLEGLVMATRSGSVDPGALLWLLDRSGRDVQPRLGSTAEMSQALEYSSGLLALGGTADMRELVVLAERGDADARLALDVYVHRLHGAIGAMAASLGGLDALVFTGGVGERSAEVRARALAPLGFLGLVIDANANRLPQRDDDPSHAVDCEIGARGAPARALVIAAREDLEIARQVRALLSTGGR
jgi:acetate kinase